MRSLVFVVIGYLLFMASGCQTVNTQQFEKKYVKNKPLDTHYVGLAVYDPSENKYLIEKNADRYFTPASNTKLLTLFAATELLADSTIGIEYNIVGDTLYFRGVGDPTILNMSFADQPVIDFLRDATQTLVFMPGRYADPKLGPGWSWDDYQYSYQPERSEMPLYENMANFYYSEENQRFEGYPSFFTSYIEIDSTSYIDIGRELGFNIFRLNPLKWKDKQDTIAVPYIVSDDLVATLLGNAIDKKVLISKTYKGEFPYQRKNIPLLPLYARLMQASDNFIAEQLLINASNGRFGTQLSGEATVSIVQNQHFKNHNSQPVWMDGSGLSRFNLMTPRSLVEITTALYNKIPSDELFMILPTGGVSGTLKDWYKADQPYVFAKTGTLRNNHSLTGFLKTKSNKTLIFSFQNSNFIGSSSAVKEEMEKVLIWIRDTY
jgi:D-alanyl-D-alanine carboxypeptidase/D-alanyl-D-alanine-endopeptidase (penicillin-binding protein 4)